MKRLKFATLSLCLSIPALSSWAADSPALEIFKKGWPRAFYFRQSEGMAAAGAATFEEWESRFLTLNGIMGKAQDEEVPGRSKRNIGYFTRYKKSHPEKLVLLHYNGNARDPRDRGEKFFAGHWLYYNGCKIAEDLPAESGESTVALEDPSLFQANTGRYQDKNEDIGLCLLGPDGKPDWSRCEQLQLISMDAANNTLTVQRGAFGSTPMAFPRGRGYIAAHVFEGPWGKNSNLLWAYNYSTTCPKDSRGQACADVLAADLASLFNSGGPLEAFDGLEFDVMGFTKLPASGIVGARAVDADADGKADGGYRDGINVYGIGVYQFHEKLRHAIGDARLIMADGAGARNQRSFGVLNGIESEGWPTLSDWEIVDWSGGLNRHFFWRDNARRPSLNYINHKFRSKGEKSVVVPPNVNRLVMAAALFTDSAVTYSSLPPKAEGRPMPIWDELVMGAENKTNWLGKPLGETRRLGLETPDVLQSAGRNVTKEFLARWASADAAVSVEAGGKSLKIAAKDPAQANMRLVFSGLAVPEGDLLIHCKIAADPRRGYPKAIPRLVLLGCQGAGQLIRPGSPRAGQAVRGAKETPLDGASGAMVEYQSQLRVGAESHEAYQVHPPFKGRTTGCVFWEQDVQVPSAPCRLEFFTGLREAPGKSDGLVYSVFIRADGKQEKVFENWHKDYGWEKHEADLSPWAGRTATLRFVADSGPNDNSTADHGSWGDAYLTAGAPHFRRSPYSPGQVMAFANEKPFAAGFYFRDAGPAAVDLTLQIEGGEPLYISDFSVHNAADAMAREYERGAVLANPSMRDYAFDLAKLFPKARLRRFQGTPSQDPQTNNGRPVGETITLGQRDAIFLAKE